METLDVNEFRGSTKYVAWGKIFVLDFRAFLQVFWWFFKKIFNHQKYLLCSVKINVYMYVLLNTWKFLTYCANWTCAHSKSLKNLILFWRRSTANEIAVDKSNSSNIITRIPTLFTGIHMYVYQLLQQFIVHFDSLCYHCCRQR